MASYKSLRKDSRVELRVERDVLADAVTWAAKTIPSRPAIPVLAGIKLVADSEGTLQVSAYDPETTALIETEASVDTAGECLVNGYCSWHVAATVVAVARLF